MHADEYRIRVQGRLGARWAAYFDGLSISAGDDGTTAIHGPVADQAALHGLLQRLRDLGLPLVSLTHVPPDASGHPSPRRARTEPREGS